MSIIHFIQVICFAILIYYLVLSIWYSVLLIASFPEVIKKFKETKYGNILTLIEQEQLIPLTIVTPVFNEEKRILNTVHSLLRSDYKNIKIILVNDGSRDNTMDLLMREFLLQEIPTAIRQTITTCTILHTYQSQTHPNLIVLDKQHSSDNTSADSLNAGLNACQTPLMLTVDADTILEPEALSRILLAFLSKRHSIAVSGSIYVLNENKLEQGQLLTAKLPSHFIPAVQAVEYLRSFLYGRAGLNLFGGSLCYPGAYTLFETKALRDVGGFDRPNFANDAEITIKLHHWMRAHNYPYTMQHSPNSFCWTEVPANWKSYWTQREKWQRGLWRSVLLHIKMCFNPRYGIVGMLTFPFFILFEILGSVVEFVSLCIFLLSAALHIISFTVLLWYLFLAWGFITFISVSMVFLNLISFNKYRKPGDIFKIVGLVFLEMLGFRQYRLLSSIYGTAHYFIRRLLGHAL